MNILNKTLLLATFSTIASMSVASDDGSHEEQSSGSRLSEIETEKEMLREKMKRYDAVETAIRLKSKEKELISLQHDIDKMKKEAEPKPPEVNLEELEKAHKEEIEGAVAQTKKEMSKSHKDHIDKVKRAFESEKKQLQNRIDELEESLQYHADKEKDISVYVTKISGIGSDIKALVFYNNRHIERMVGQSIADGMIVDEIRPDGILIATSHGSVFAPLVNNDTAYVLGNKHIVHKITKDLEKKSENSPGTIAAPEAGAIPLFGFPPNAAIGGGGDLTGF